MAAVKVKWFNDRKGFGFISPRNGSADSFVHHISIKTEGFKSLSVGQGVGFEIEWGPKSSNAIDVVAQEEFTFE